MSEDLHIRQEQERREIESYIADCAHYNDTTKVTYQGLTDGLHQSEVVFKTMQDVITSARMAITKAQGLIQD